MPEPTADQIRDAVSASEVPTTSYWREQMFKARQARGWTQDDLAGRVGVSQPTISTIESGAQPQSSYVPAIALVLGIPLPHILVRDEYDERWVEAGRALRHRKLSYFLKQLEAFEEIAKEADAE